MIIVLQSDASKKDLERVSKLIESYGLTFQILLGKNNTIIEILDKIDNMDLHLIKNDPIVVGMINTDQSKLNVESHLDNKEKIIDVSGVKVGGQHVAIIAGPCSVESKEQVILIAKAAKAAGANMLRGGAFKPRTSPYSFQGIGLDGLDILLEAKKVTGLPIVSELVSEKYLDEFDKKVDLIQIGARNMYNYELLKQLGRTKKPILLKRGLSATYEEWINAAEYIVASGNPNVILCERGIRTFEDYTRNTLDIQSIPVIKKLTKFPIIIDPSHAGGKWWMVNSMAKAGIVAGANGVMIEVHNCPTQALSDGEQSLEPNTFNTLMNDLKKLISFIGKKI